jgi:biotin operon repressor
MDRIGAELLKTFDGPASTATNEELATKLKTSVRSVKRAISRLKHVGKLRVESRGRTRLLIPGASELSEDLLSMLLPEGPRERLLEALKRGPISTADALAAARCSSSWFRRIILCEREQGTIFTGMYRGKPGISLKPLTDRDAQVPEAPPAQTIADVRERDIALIDSFLVERAMASLRLSGPPTRRAKMAPRYFSEDQKLMAIEAARASGAGNLHDEAVKRLIGGRGQEAFGAMAP